MRQKEGKLAYLNERTKSVLAQLKLKQAIPEGASLNDSPYIGAKALNSDSKL